MSRIKRLFLVLELLCSRYYTVADILLQFERAGEKYQHRDIFSFNSLILPSFFACSKAPNQTP